MNIDATNHNYCESLFNYRRNRTTVVRVGTVDIGGDTSIKIQSMTTTDTLDSEQTAQQTARIIEAGGELVRITAQGRREAKNLQSIKDLVRQKGYNTPLVADIHFNANAAVIAAGIVEKVRINPGNFTGDAKKFDFDKYSDELYNEELERMKEIIVPFLNVCKENNTAIRIGTNHGSLSDRIMSRYGDTPEGMVEACMEYLRICEENDFHNIVLSIKSSNTRVMVHTVRLLVATMKQEGMQYPLHLGVTEAGSEDEGRIKSAVGSGALLVDGIGDTLRVSLTEAPEKEIPVAKILVSHIIMREKHAEIPEVKTDNYSPYEYRRRKTHQVLNIGADSTVAVIAPGGVKDYAKIGIANKPDYFIVDDSDESPELIDTPSIIPYERWRKNRENNSLPLVETDSLPDKEVGDTPIFLKVRYSDMGEKLFGFLQAHPNVILLLESNHINSPVEQRAFILELMNRGLTHPVVVVAEYAEDDKEKFQIVSAADMGILFLDGLADGLLLKNSGNISLPEVVDTSFGILQASRVQFSKTEFISCPGCGRTLFDLQNITKEIKERTKHLKGVKVGIMGCIVNGVGEMADAEYGYVGSGPGAVSLFRKRELVKKNINSGDAVEELVNLIKEFGDWVEP
jgi:(E)-4-hydroxy-3-methylbut-2-enyl-diphosphate synthase